MKKQLGFPFTVEDKCPLGGDVSNGCADCAYRSDYCYDSKTGECIERERLTQLV